MLSFSQKFLIFLNIYIDLICKDQNKAKEKYHASSDRLEELVNCVVNDTYKEIDDMFPDGLQLAFRKESAQVYVLTIRFDPALVSKFCAVLAAHRRLSEKDKTSDYDEVLRDTVYHVLPKGNGVAIKIKRGQAE